MEPCFRVYKDLRIEISFDDRIFASYHQLKSTEDSRMAAIISQSLHDVVMASARSKHQGSTETLTEMYREHARVWAAGNEREFGAETERKIFVLVERQHRLS
jgi:4-hydroxy-L-threonine phosphate dehydrogenase PdxA